MLGFGSYSPDQAALESPGATRAQNILPRAKNRRGYSYGPVPSLAAVTTALPDRCRGAYTARDAEGSAQTFAGTSTHLYRLAGRDWVDVRSAAYTTHPAGAWEYAQIGAHVIAANFADPLQVYTIGTDTAFSDLSSDAPRGRHIAQIHGVPMIGDTHDATDGARGNRVWWPSFENPSDWPEIGTADAHSKLSDRRDLPAGGRVRGIRGPVGGVDGGVWMDDAVYRIIYVGSPEVFQFQEVEGARGTPAPGSIASVGDVAFYLGEDDFYLFDGQSSRGIGDQRIARTIFREIDQDQLHLVSAAVDPESKLYWCAYSTRGATLNKAAVYHWGINEWGTADLRCEYLIRDLTQSYTLDQLDTFGTMETLPASLDSRQWSGKRPVLAAFTTSHELGRLSGPNLEAVIETTEYSGTSVGLKAGQRMFIDDFRPLVDAPSSAVSGYLRLRERPGDALGETPERGVDADGAIHFAREARYARAGVRIAAGADWTHAQGIEPSISPAGTL